MKAIDRLAVIRHKSILNKNWRHKDLFRILRKNDIWITAYKTIKINNDVDIENDVIKKYNVVIDSIIEKIQKLKKWNEFIEFEGKCYGITCKVVNNIHRENDCFGEMVFIRKETTYTSNDQTLFFPRLSKR